MLEAGQLGYIHTDHLDTPRLITRPGGQALWRWESDPFGNTAADTNPGGLGAYGFNLRFAGQYFDAESGLHYNGARYYDPQSGRYTQSDPIGIAGGLNAYVYANNQPTMQTDATGQCPLCIAALVGGIIGGGLDLVGQLADHGGQWGCVDGGQVAKSALTGAALGVAGEAAVALMGNAALEAAAIDGAVAQAASVEAGMASAEGVAAVAAKEAQAASKVFSKEKQALLEMAKADKKAGMTAADMQAYKDLNKKLPDPFPSNKVRGPEAHNAGAPTSREPHGHVGPVDHIPIRDPLP